MRYELRYSPIHVSRTAKRNAMGRQTSLLQARGDKKHLKIEIEGSLALISIIPQIRQRPRFTFRTRILRLSERCECFGSNHPGRYSGPKVLGQEWTQRLVLPTLDVACGPVVEETKPSYMLVGLA